MQRKIKGIYTAQLSEKECAVAAFSMILKSFGSYYSSSVLSFMMKTDLNGTSVYGIVQTAESLKIKTKAVNADKTLFEMKGLPYPFIVHVIKDNKYEHYYVVFKTLEESILIGDPDPDVGIVKMKKEEFFKEWTGTTIFFETTDKYVASKSQKKNFFDFKKIFIENKKILIAISFLSIFLLFVNVTTSYFLQYALDHMIPDLKVNELTIFLIILIINYILYAIFSYIRNVSLTILGQRLGYTINKEYIQHLLKLPFSFFINRKKGDIIARFDDSSKIVDALGSSIISLILDCSIVVVMSIILVIKSPILFVFSLISLPLYFIVIISFEKSFDKGNKEFMAAGSSLNSALVESINGIETIKAFSIESYHFHFISREIKKLIRKVLSLNKKEELQQNLKSFIDMTMYILVIYVGSILIMKNKLTVGQLIAYTTLSVYFTEPIQNILRLQPKIKSAQVASERLNDVFLTPTEHDDAWVISQSKELQGNIEISNLNFRYGYYENTLTDINLVIHENEKLTIVGMSGSGKTTLANLLVGLYKLENKDSSITMNGFDINTISRTAIREHIVYVPQEPFIFSGTILDNLCLGRKDKITNEEVDNVVEIAQIKDDIMKFSLKYNTELSEYGTNLSGGQKQRLSLARALLSPAKILILDEATSNLDTVTENKIIERLLEIPDKTIIFIAHRLTIAEKSNNIVVIDRGEIVEKGTHQQLLSRKALYHKLYNGAV